MVSNKLILLCIIFIIFIILFYLNNNNISNQKPETFNTQPQNNSRIISPIKIRPKWAKGIILPIKIVQI